MTEELARPFIILVKRFIVITTLAGLPALLTAQEIPASGGSPEHLADVEITSHSFKPAEFRAPAAEQLLFPTDFASRSSRRMSEMRESWRWARMAPFMSRVANRAMF